MKITSSHQIRHVIFSLLNLLTFLSLSYSLCLLSGVDFQVILAKLQSMLLGKSLHFLFSRLGWCGGGLVIAVVFSLLDPNPFWAEQSWSLLEY